jgi:ATP-dependent DNA helicase RecG
VFPQGKRRVFKITFADGAVARCDDQHIWRVHVAGNTPSGVYKNLQMLEVLERFNSGWQKINVPTLDRLEMPMAEDPVPMDPYLLGLMLGDGTFAQRMGYCTVDEELANYVLANGVYEVSPDPRSGLRCFIPTQEIRDQVVELGLKETRSHTKFVPTIYLNNSPEVRLAVLQGLMDTDGTIDKKGYVTFCSVSLQLAKDVQYLARSLGAKATLTSKLSGNVGANGVPHQEAHRIYVSFANKFFSFTVFATRTFTLATIGNT